MAPHIAAITLGVRDVRRSVDFYRAMGFEPDVRSDGRVALFQLNGLVLQVVRRGVIDPEMGGGYPGEGLISLRHNVTASAEVDAIITLVSRAGGRVLRAPRSGVDVGRRAWFADPDGHRWEVMYDPSLRRDEHGGAWLPPRKILSPFDGDGAMLPDDDTEDLGHALETAEVPAPYSAVPVAVVEEYEEERPTVALRSHDAVPAASERAPASRRPRPRPRPRPSDSSAFRGEARPRPFRVRRHHPRPDDEVPNRYGWPPLRDGLPRGLRCRKCICLEAAAVCVAVMGRPVCMRQGDCLRPAGG